MAQPQPEENVTLNQVLKLVDHLSPGEKGKLRRALDKSWAERWQMLCDRVQERNQGLAPITDDEIMAEIKSAREARRAQRAENSN